MIPTGSLLPLAGLIVVSMTSLLLLLARNWRSMLLALGVQYLGLLLLLALTLQVTLASVKMLAGWTVVGILWVGAAGQVEEYWQVQLASAGRVFRLLSAGIVLVAVYSIAPAVETWLPAPDRFSLLAGVTLISLGLLHLGLTADVFRFALGLLTVLSGFEILYAFVENSVLVTGLLAGLTLGIGLVSFYLLVAPQLEAVE
jgi:hypothetical protein